MLVKHGKCLDAATRGAASLSNLLLAELAELAEPEETRRPELADEYREKLATWAQTDLPGSLLDGNQHAAVRIPSVWGITAGC